MASKNIPDNEKVEQFKSITGSDHTIANNMLEAFDNNLEMAINMFLEGNSDIGGSATALDEQLKEVNEVPATHVSGASAAVSSRSSTTVYKEPGKQAVTKKAKASVICDDDEDEVRAPIPQRQEVLVDDQYHAIPYNPRPRRVANTVFNACRDFKKETEEYEEMLKTRKDPIPSKKRKRLHDLFQPPTDLIHYGDFQSARDVCNQKKMWLMVNIQKSTEFGCQVLNRDVWSNNIVRDMVDANFILWQVAHDSDEGLHYATFYSVKEYPHISIIDPRTGEQMVIWQSFGTKPTAEQFAELCTFFLSEHTSLNESLGSTDSSKQIDKKSVIDLCEEDQLQKALLASRETCNDTNTAASVDEESEDDGGGKDGEFNNHSDNVVYTNGKLTEKNGPPDIIKCSSDGVSNDNSDTQRSKSNSPSTGIVATCNDKTNKNTAINSDINDKDFSALPGEKATILLRLPDNGRKQILFPLECTLQELSSELSRLGWSCTDYEVIKAFPRQNISQLDQELTLRAAGLHKQETLFIQDR